MLLVLKVIPRERDQKSPEKGCGGYKKGKGSLRPEGEQQSTAKGKKKKKRSSFSLCDLCMYSTQIT
ncbi:hypothetical protein Taro_034182 [Colocasia esculenta]|uniref:Uncharacterized protein n=1 Tax=Colocasia esculenta TaxID=4460 RepID=A0A843W021_COLES|nr:hypothetical protein [Colocasia esculenta]